MHLWCKRAAPLLAGAALLTGSRLTLAAPIGGREAKGSAVQVTYLPYLQPGHTSKFGPTDKMIIAWQTNETAPNSVPGAPYAVTVQPAGGGAVTTVTPTGRVVNNYLASDPQFAALIDPASPTRIPTLFGARVNYYAVLSGLQYNTSYTYTVTGPGLPIGGFTATFHTRKTGPMFSFQVQGDEGYYPGIPNQAPLTIDYEARIIHLMNNAQSIALPGQPALPAPDLALNTGDNVYLTGADSNYRDIWFPDWNNNIDSNETGAPFIRSIPLYIVVGNHDVGSTGATANLLADTGATVPGAFGPGPFGGGVGGGDALAYFNNYYFPLNGPAGTDIQYRFNGDSATPTNFFFNYTNVNYTSPTAIEALRGSTTVDTGTGPTRQIDHTSNYSFDYGNAHFLFLDANPHVFNNLLPGGPPANPPAFPFPPYPAALRDFVINDLDGSSQTWKVVVFHQPAISSGNATVSNDQMRRVSKFLEDHGVNMVFSGHEHNYQRSLPLRALAGIDQTPAKAGSPVVAVDTRFDGVTNTVPNGVLYFVEGAGGNRDFDDNLPNPRGGGLGIDQDDAATGIYSTKVNGTTYNFINGPAAWLDTNLTTDAMKAFVPGAGSGPKITAKFKSKVFSFADIVVNNNTLTLYQITEPLTNTTSATPGSPAPYGTDVNGSPLNDPIGDTVFDPRTLSVTTPPATGTPALLDKITVTKPDVSVGAGRLIVSLSAPPIAAQNGTLTYTVTASNQTGHFLTGVQAVVTLPAGTTFASPSTTSLTAQGQNAVITIGPVPPGITAVVQVKAQVAVPVGTLLNGTAVVRSATVLPVATNTVTTRVTRATPPPPGH